MTRFVERRPRPCRPNLISASDGPRLPLGPLDVGGQKAYAYCGLDDDGALIPPEITHTDAKGLGALAKRYAAQPVRCEPDLAEAARPLGFEPAPLPEAALLPWATLAYGRRPPCRTRLHATSQRRVPVDPEMRTILVVVGEVLADPAVTQCKTRREVSNGGAAPLECART